MKTFIQLAFPTGHLYELPTSVIANNRAACMRGLHAEEFPTPESALEDTTELFEDEYQVKDWALNNMNPDEYMPHARLVRYTPPDKIPADAEWSYHDAPAIIAQLDEATVLDLPVEMTVAAMAAHNRVCQIAVLNGEDGKPQCAIVLIQGGPGVVGYYQGALELLTSRLVTPPKSPDEAGASPTDTSPPETKPAADSGDIVH